MYHCKPDFPLEQESLEPEKAEFVKIFKKWGHYAVADTAQRGSSLILWKSMRVLHVSCTHFCREDLSHSQVSLYHYVSEQFSFKNKCIEWRVSIKTHYRSSTKMHKSDVTSTFLMPAFEIRWYSRMMCIRNGNVCLECRTWLQIV